MFLVFIVCLKNSAEVWVVVLLVVAFTVGRVVVLRVVWMVLVWMVVVLIPSAGTNMRVVSFAAVCLRRGCRGCVLL
ncbi:hypothetical protein E2C01_067454 [Portunus trituberculatus]|uniref:Uncharacterized protein n=1 Tax=Portunus trituberculatus TaxID=210409 RepID=A0A5B7HV33_PORTR|nr:hypothetical protein [Portunus trituberculatus]